MVKKYKLHIILSSTVILLPILYGILMYNRLPLSLVTHWGADGAGDGSMGKALAVFGLPLILLALHLFCIFITLRDNKHRNQSPKTLGMIFCIVPAISVFANGTMYASALGESIDVAFLTPAMLGIMFIVIGNYLPKITQNRTLGIKLPWTMRNEENWSKTHRLCGKLWVAGGFAILICSFLPLQIKVIALVVTILILTVAPVVYSYGIYRKHRSEGIAYIAPPRSKTDIIILAVLVPCILIGVGFLIFTGDIEVNCNDGSFTVNADYISDIEVEYSKIDSVKYLDSFEKGVRTNGFGSPRLSMGTFENDMLGEYTLYSYTKADEYILLTSNGKSLVIGLETPKQTKDLYNTILENTAN